MGGYTSYVIGTSADRMYSSSPRLAALDVRFALTLRCRRTICSLPSTDSGAGG